MIWGLWAESPKRVSRTVQTLFRTGGTSLKRGFAPCKRLFSGSHSRGRKTPFAPSPKHSWAFWLFRHLYQASGVAIHVYQKRKFSPKRKFLAGYPCGHPAKNFGQALQMLEKTSILGRTTRADVHEKTSVWKTSTDFSFPSVVCAFVWQTFLAWFWYCNFQDFCPAAKVCQKLSANYPWRDYPLKVARKGPRHTKNTTG